MVITDTYCPMRILFDYQAFEFQNYGGVSRSYVELISHLRDRGCDYTVGIKESDNLYLREKNLVPKIKPLHYQHKLLFEGKKLFKGQRLLTRKVMCWYGYENDCWQVNKDYCVKLLKKQQFDVFEPTFFDSYFLPYLKDKPFVMTVHDMIPELFPEFFPKDDFQIVHKKQLCSLASHIHVPSEKTKDDLLNILSIDPERVSVIPHGRQQYKDDTCLLQPIVDFPYLLFVGERNGYKNFSAFLGECSNIVKRFPEIHVLCTGRVFNEKEKKEIGELGLGEKVVHFFADETVLRNLYHYAVVFVYPSAYEGFGLPILEAFANDCPVMLNNASCFPEVAGDAAIYFDIDKEGDLYEKFVEFYLSGTEVRETLKGKGRLRMEQYSWEKSSELLKNIYESLV